MKTINELQKEVERLRLKLHAEEKYNNAQLSNLHELAHSKIIKSVYTVWVGGGEVNDHYVNLSEAKDIKQMYLDEGYDDVIIEELILSTK
jgi:phosphotransferase system IIB component|tara:strand:- start:353 stop:622 length:270 start_codon:yes stop_codon:yes gene_type:complete